MTEYGAAGPLGRAFDAEPGILRADRLAAELISGARADAEPSGTQPPAGAVVAIIDGEQTLVSTAGDAHLPGHAEPDRSTAEPMTTSHVHDLASVSKVLTTLTAMRLFSRGALALSDTLDRFFGNSAGPYAAVTLEDLLRHRSGMRPWWPLYLAPGEPQDTIFSLDPANSPRVQCRYSDLGMQTLGAVISRVTAQPFERAVRELLLDPLRADTVTPSAPHPDAPVVSGGLGDAIERDMIASDSPYPVSAAVKASAAEFSWRESVIRGQVGDCNAFHAFGGVAGHAGWFSDVAGLLAIAEVLAEPERLEISPAVARQSGDAPAPQPEGADYLQGLGVRTYSVRWRGEDRVFLGHPGFTGTFLAASPATPTAPRALAVMLTNRLHGSPPPARNALASVDGLWRRAMGSADDLLHAPRTGGSS